MYCSSWIIPCRRCSNYIFILNLTPGFDGLGKDNCEMRRETFKFWRLVHLVLEVWGYIFCHVHKLHNVFTDHFNLLLQLTSVVTLWQHHDVPFLDLHSGPYHAAGPLGSIGRPCVSMAAPGCPCMQWSHFAERHQWRYFWWPVGLPTLGTLWMAHSRWVDSTRDRN